MPVSIGKMVNQLSDFQVYCAFKDRIFIKSGSEIISALNNSILRIL